MHRRLQTEASSRTLHVIFILSYLADDKNDEVIYPTNGRHKKQGRYGFRNDTDAHDCHKTIQKCNAQNSNNPGRSDDGESAEQENHIGDNLFFGAMHLLHLDVGKAKKRSVSRESAIGGSKLNLEYFVLIFLYR